ncbi:uncharacterized protein I206_107375 [Kwoniella pini CBS 10737]|uniref:D-amino-acid oxidase n=1 Tax=Kwoniella pini CBS 10737 TaxID=1296096 RepID=A0A1B9HX59_9TREE|nr:D-amino-acid oxidase [Kwoniella pini CBS 10737]OCF47841.1 D-amino-acid oxidase [Kwoniella pini CBS 10737]
MGKESHKQRYDAVVLGCGVLGLSIANELVKKGLKVVVVGKDLPEDIHSTGFASPWAGANWHSFAQNAKERKRDEITFKEFAKLSKEVPELCERRPYFYYWKEKGKWKIPWYKDLVFGYRDLSSDEVPKPFLYGVTYEAYTLNTPLYLQHLAKNLRKQGIPISRERVSSLEEVFNLPLIGKVNLVINATGLGSKSLLGVEDLKVFPAKGQTILVEASNVKNCYGIEDEHFIKNQKVYIIPRPGNKKNNQNHVILGGCYLPNDWSLNINKEIAKNILKDCYELCPLLDNNNGKGSINDIKILSHNVGLRPVREGGLRLELEDIIINKSEKENNLLLPLKGREKERKVSVIHAYGIGPAGYQSSLGIAKEAGALVDEWLKKGNKARL